jgi:hypothetical protein
MKFIKNYKSFNKINEMTEFNLQRFNTDSVQASMHVNDPNLSTDAFNRHEDNIRVAMSRVNDIMGKLSGSSDYSKLRSKLSLEDQDIKSLKILRINKIGINYDVYISFVIGEEEYWGVIEDIMSNSPELTSEVFRDHDLFQAKEWVIKTRGFLIKVVKEWLKPEPGNYKLLNDQIICYSTETGKQFIMDKGIEIELIRSHSDKLIIKYDSDKYNLVGDNYMYFNWWFQKL